MIELDKGQKIKINFNTPLRNDVSITCEIKECKNDRISLVFPKEQQDFIKDLPEGKEIEVVIYTNSGIFAFESIIINSPLEQDFVIELPDEKKKIQRRDYIRTPINLKLVLNREDMNYETRTINVGGGGIRFVSKEKPNINDLWKFMLVLPEGKTISGLGKVLYTLLQGSVNASVITFTDITETERNRLIKLCLDEEIKNLKYKKANS
ncbi:MAG TPA: PilZ domain-containing protein [Candidatus Gastranaerophilales bacterium]|nr:PilZ domain-containing protein [Candidatus Gastranaerophilales bacterium]